MLEDSIPGLPPAVGVDKILKVMATPELPVALQTNGAPNGYVYKKSRRPVTFSVPWAKLPRCVDDWPFYIAAPGVPVSLDTEMATIVPYTGDSSKDGDNTVWSGAAMNYAISAAVVDIFGRVLYNAIIQPPYEPANWNTWVSGISREKVISGTPVYYMDARLQLAQVLAYRPVFGSSVRLDFLALGLDLPPGCELVEMQSHGGVLQCLAAKKISNCKLESMYEAATGDKLRSKKEHSALQDALAAVRVMRVCDEEYKRLYDDYVRQRTEAGQLVKDCLVPRGGTLRPGPVVTAEQELAC